LRFSRGRPLAEKVAFNCFCEAAIAHGRASRAASCVFGGTHDALSLVL
jgi:hypothetical protein